MKPARCVCLGALLAWLGWMVFFLGCWQPTSPSPKSLTPSPSPLTLPPVLSPSQLVWSGGQLCPIVPSEINPYGGLAWEPISKTFFTIGRLQQNILRISNVIGAGSDPAAFPRAALLKTYLATANPSTDIYAGLRTCSPNNGKPVSEGLFWDSVANCLWVNYGGDYAVSHINDPCLLGIQGLIPLSGDRDQGTGVRGQGSGVSNYCLLPPACCLLPPASWPLPPASGNTTRACGPYRLNVASQLGREWAFRLPPAFAAAYTGGRQLCLGAGVTSGSAACSWGPNVIAIDNPPAFGKGNPTPILNTSILAVYPQSNRLERTADYTAWKGTPGLAGSFVAIPQGSDQFGAIVAGIGQWNSCDYVRAACCINLPDCQGILFFVSQGYGNVWYGNPTETTDTGLTLQASCGAAKGPTSAHCRDLVYIYSLADLVPPAAGQQTPDLVVPRWTFSLSSANPGMKWNCWQQITGAVFRPDQRDVIIIAQGAEELGPGNYNPILYRFAIGARGQESGDRNQETGDRRQESVTPDP